MIVAGDESPTAAELRNQVRYLEAEVAALRRRLLEHPADSRSLESRLSETQASLASVTAQNERLADTLREAREKIDRKSVV